MWEQRGAWAAKRIVTPLRGSGKSATYLGEGKRFIFTCVRYGWNIDVHIQWIIRSVEMKHTKEVRAREGQMTVEKMIDKCGE